MCPAESNSFAYFLGHFKWVFGGRKWFQSVENTALLKNFIATGSSFLRVSTIFTVPKIRTFHQQNVLPVHPRVRPTRLFGLYSWQCHVERSMSYHVSLILSLGCQDLVNNCHALDTALVQRTDNGAVGSMIIILCAKLKWEWWDRVDNALHDSKACTQ